MRIRATLDAISLRQAALWLGLLPPQEDPRLEILDGYPRWIGTESEFAVLEPDRHAEIRAAMAEITRALIEGRVQASGRPVTDEAALRPRFDFESYRAYPDAYEDLLVAEAMENPTDDGAVDVPPAPLAPIPAAFWDPDRIDWDAGIARSHASPAPEEIIAYLDVRLCTEDMRPLLRRRRGAPLAPDVAQPNRGRPPVYDVAGFYRLLFWEERVNGLPETQAGVIARAQELLLAAWGEANTPGETWVKARVRELFDARERHDAARRAMLA